jgi:sulfur-oxidizing protein SoxZ
MALEKPRIKMPDKANVGDIIEIRALVTHIMETGQRRDAKTNQFVPRLILNSFVAKFAGAEVFRMKLQPGISANPFVSFHMRVPGPGELELTWTEDSGDTAVERARLEVA